MRVSVLDKKRRLALAVALVATTQCTLLNPLDHLRSGRDTDGSLSDAAAAADDGAAASEAGGPELPGCAPERWSECGVLVVATPNRPGGVAAGYTTGAMIFYSDEESGEIFQTSCTASQCEPPTRIVAGEDGPRSLAFTSDSVFWTTKAAVKRLRLVVPPDAGVQQPQKLDDVSGVAEIAATYPIVMWSDDHGVRITPINTPSGTSVWSSPATQPLTDSQGHVAFVSGGAVETCTFDWLDTRQCQGAAGALPGIDGAVLIARAGLFAFGLFQANVPLFVTHQRGDGVTELLVSDHDDAGAPLALAEEPSAIRALAANATHVYWTTETGELRRRRKDDTRVNTILRGLGPDTQIVALSDQILVADRTMSRVLLVSPQ